MNTIYDLIAHVDNEWFTFSPDGHSYYKNDNIKIHGKMQFLQWLKNNHKSAKVIPVYGKTYYM